MRSYRAMWVSVMMAVWMVSVESVEAQSYERVQPIILTASPVCCQSPADTASQPVCLPAGDRNYLSAADRDPMTMVSVASELMPLPACQVRPTSEPLSTFRPVSTSQQWRGYDSHALTVVEYPAPSASLSSSTPVYVLRPLPTAPLPPAVPAGYVLGQGMIGQPKLYKPGQPVRNFLRYISL